MGQGSAAALPSQSPGPGTAVRAARTDALQEIRVSSWLGLVGFGFCFGFGLFVWGFVCVPVYKIYCSEGSQSNAFQGHYFLKNK